MHPNVSLLKLFGNCYNLLKQIIMKSAKGIIVFVFFTAVIIILSGCKKEVENPPLPVLSINTDAVSTITATSAETGGIVTASASEAIRLILVGVCWDTKHNPTVGNNKTIAGNSLGSFSSRIDGLIPNSTYYVRAYATYGVRPSETYIWETAYGPEISFRSDDVGLATLTTTAVTSITYVSAGVGINISYDGGGNLTEKGICWGTSENPTTNDSKKKYAGVEANNNFLMANLKPSTRYYVRAYATNSAGTAYGNEIDFTTLPINPIIFNPDLAYGSVSDIDGNVYKTIQIGTQLWMAQNLRTTKYNDGTSIPEVTDGTEWNNLTTPGYCWYNNDASSFKDTFGALYNWNAVSTNKLCPTGWHVPVDSEFSSLFLVLGYSGETIRETGNTHWLSNNTGSTNSSGFTGLPGGFRNTGQEGMFAAMSEESMWWSGTDKGALGGYLASWWDWESGITITQYQGDKNYGMSVRCVKDN
jgi:uncharacterized protein (TIGR02145 family)